MPTVKYKCMDSGKMKSKVFPYNAVGKAQATEFAKTIIRNLVIKIMQIDLNGDKKADISIREVL